MRKFKRLTIALAALFIASATAWADEAKVYTEAVALNSLKAGDVLTDGFKLTTEKGQYIYVKGYKKDGGTAETSDYTQLNADNSTFPGGVTISESGSTYTPYADGKDANAWIVSDWKDLGSAIMLYLDGYNYTPTEWSLTPDKTGKTWTLDKMPASNVELQVEYYAESNLFLSKDALADQGSITVKAGDLGLQFDKDGKSANTVTEGTPMTVTYNGTKKLLGMKVEKKEATSSQLSAVTTDDIGKVVCAAGHLHDAKTAVPDGCTAVGILGKVTETGHGLILALQNATEQSWNTINGWTSVTDYAGTTLKVLPDAARGTNLTSYTTLGGTTVSNWAVAQKSDYEAIFTNLGSTKSDGNGTTYDGNVNAYITTGVGGTAISDLNWYWSASENGDNAWYFANYDWDSEMKDTEIYIRPVLGF